MSWLINSLLVVVFVILGVISTWALYWNGREILGGGRLAWAICGGVVAGFGWWLAAPSGISGMLIAFGPGGEALSPEMRAALPADAVRAVKSTADLGWQMVHWANDMQIAIYFFLVFLALFVWIFGRDA